MKLPTFVFLLIVTGCASIDKDRESIQCVRSEASGILAAVTGRTESCTCLVSNDSGMQITEYEYDTAKKTCKAKGTEQNAH